jgi:transposase-like protein
MSQAKVMALLLKALKNVPNNNRITEGLSKRFSGYLMLDAKYVSVKGRSRKMAFIWVIDYYKHDILFSLLVPDETYTAYWNCLKFLKRINVPVRAIICDEHKAILQASQAVFPRARIQYCHTHILRNIQYQLDVRVSQEDRIFLKKIKGVFTSKKVVEYSRKATVMVRRYGGNPKYLAILADLDRKHEQLITYLIDRRCPRTTNLIEGYNSHLAQRLKAIKGFESYATAEMWLNAFTVLKRITPFTDCEGRFSRLNGESPLFQTVEDAGPVSKVYEYFGREFR